MAASNTVPERIGRYDLLLPIASGGMATVYLARSTGAGGFERDVALKLMHAHLREMEEFAAELIEEAKLGVRIRHANVVSVLDVGEDPHGVFLVMEYIEGDTLGGLLRSAASEQAPLPLPVGMKVLLDALAGLHAAHELRDERGAPVGLVHRDFSPQNVLVGLDGVARLADFGVAKAATRLGHTKTGLVKGKIAYMAPEQARDLNLDRRCDVWAAGVIAWELLAGRRLHRKKSDAAILLDLVSEAPPRLRTVRSDIPSALDEAVARALTLDPDARWPTAERFANALIAGLEGYVLRPEAAEVAAYVGSVVGARVAERSARAGEIARLRAEAASLAGAAEAEIATGPAVVAELGSASTPGAAKPAPVRSPSRVRYMLWGASALLGASVAIWKLGGGSTEPAAPDAPPLASPAAPPSDPETATRGEPPSPASASSPAIPSDLVVHADAAMASLQLGSRVVPIPQPAKVVTLPLENAERTNAVQLAARAVDGRSAVAAVAPGATSVVLTFPALAKPRARSAPAVVTTTLAKSPYEGPP